MLKVNMSALVFNRGSKELGQIVRKWKRKGITFYNVQLERGHLMENLTDDIEKPCYILIELSEKLNKK